MNENNFIKLLEYLNGKFTEEKVEIDSHGIMGLHYDGLIFEYYFEDSVLSAEYLDIHDYLQSQYHIEYNDKNTLVEQYKECAIENRHKIIEAFYNILYLSHFNDLNIDVNEVLNKIKNYLLRYNFSIKEQESVGATIFSNNKIGEGYYCDVYKVNQGIVKKQVKRFHLEDENICKRFKYEYEIMCKLKECPQIVKVFEYNETEKSYTMEECEECLYDYLKEKIDITLTEKVKIINDILEAMKYAHNHNIIHRDLHLGNILKSQGNFLVGDFGLGKDKEVIKSLITSVTLKNSHIFLDPIGYEDFTQLDEYSDIYSIGKIIDYIMCNGFLSNSHTFSYIVAKCTDRDKNNRYRNIEEIQRDLKRSLVGEEKVIKQQEINNKIKKGLYDLEVREYIMELVSMHKLCNYIVNQQCLNIYKIILKLNIVDRVQIANEILKNYALSTGYQGWTNYSLFGEIAYNIYINENSNEIKEIYEDILKYCANIRYDIKNLYDQLI